jgi:hypothetical protein
MTMQPIPTDKSEMATTHSDSKNVISIFFPDVLKEIWEDGKRDWSVYSKEQFRRFWDCHVPERRETK